MILRSKIKNIVLPLLLLFVFVSAVDAKTARKYPSVNDTLRLFTIGNSFSGNTTKYLPSIVKDRGRHIIIGRASLGGCSLERHWNQVELYEKNPSDPNANIYNPGRGKMNADPGKGQALKPLLEKDNWEIITIQQASRLSTDVSTYRPYAKKLYDYVKAIKPDAEIVMHETWAYRPDAKSFAKPAQSNEEMWQMLNKAYTEISQELGIRMIPVGDGFHMMQTDPKWTFRKDTVFDPETAKYPELPKDENSLNTGGRWNKGKFGYDYNHANNAGCYLGGLIWYGFLFGDSPENVTFVPEGVSQEMAVQLKRVAHKVLKQHKCLK